MKMKRTKARAIAKKPQEKHPRYLLKDNDSNDDDEDEMQK
jgi:hypothetical protein